MTIRAQINLEPAELEGRTVRVCVRCGTRPAEAVLQNEPICSVGGLVGGHSFADLPVCPSCGGEGGSFHPDPQLRESCDACEGVGARGPWSETR